MKWKYVYNSQQYSTRSTRPLDFYIKNFDNSVWLYEQRNKVKIRQISPRETLLERVLYYSVIGLIEKHFWKAKNYFRDGKFKLFKKFLNIFSLSRRLLSVYRVDAMLNVCIISKTKASSLFWKILSVVRLDDFISLLHSKSPFSWYLFWVRSKITFASNLFSEQKFCYLQLKYFKFMQVSLCLLSILIFSQKCLFNWLSKIFHSQKAMIEFVAFIAVSWWN